MCFCLMWQWLMMFFFICFKVKQRGRAASYVLVNDIDWCKSPSFLFLFCRTFCVCRYSDYVLHALVTVHLEHVAPQARLLFRPYLWHFLEFLLLPIFCVFIYTDINNPPRKSDPYSVQSGRGAGDKLNNNLMTKDSGAQRRASTCV